MIRIYWVDIVHLKNTFNSLVFPFLWATIDEGSGACPRKHSRWQKTLSLLRILRFISTNLTISQPGCGPGPPDSELCFLVFVISTAGEQSRSLLCPEYTHALLCHKEMQVPSSNVNNKFKKNKTQTKTTAWGLKLVVSGSFLFFKKDFCPPPGILGSFPLLMKPSVLWAKLVYLALVDWLPLVRCCCSEVSVGMPHLMLLGDWIKLSRVTVAGDSIGIAGSFLKNKPLLSEAALFWGSFPIVPSWPVEITEVLSSFLPSSSASTHTFHHLKQTLLAWSNSGELQYLVKFHLWCKAGVPSLRFPRERFINLTICLNSHSVEIKPA